MDRRSTVFYDVDTQRDFFAPDGALYVPASGAIVEALGRLTRLARRPAPRLRVLGSVCRHSAGDRELAANGGQYPEHCMDGTPGQRKLEATAPLAPRWIENRAYRPAELAALLDGDEVFFEKQDFDVLIGNRHARTVLPRLLEGVADVVVYGVVTEVCVDHAVRALCGRGVRVHVVEDAIAAVDAARGAQCVAEWRDAGVHLTTLQALERALTGVVPPPH